MSNFKENIHEEVKKALYEDIGSGDVTAMLIAENALSEAQVITRETAILAGVDWFNEVFRQLDETISIQWFADDGDVVQADQILCKLSGPARAMLTGERTALNFLQTLSGTATRVAAYVAAVAHTSVKLLDTRKTIPGMRLAQKYAVQCGGGYNHRIGLFDAFLIKENHIIAAGGMAAAVARARAINPDLLLEVEVESMEELDQAINASVDRVLLDNFNLAMLKDAAAFSAGRVELEASGNVSLETLADIAETGVDYISIGSLTKHIQAIDLSMRFSGSDFSEQA